LRTRRAGFVFVRTWLLATKLERGLAALNLEECRVMAAVGWYEIKAGCFICYCIMSILRRIHNGKMGFWFKNRAVGNIASLPTLYR
jgi:hypothetical protein